MKKQVITYFFAYVPGQITLCRDCEDKVDAEIRLGPVSHGLHKGYCAGCEDEDEAETCQNCNAPYDDVIGCDCAF